MYMYNVFYMIYNITFIIFNNLFDLQWLRLITDVKLNFTPNSSYSKDPSMPMNLLSCNLDVYNQII